jgi:hypothetical protein
MMVSRDWPFSVALARNLLTREVGSRTFVEECETFLFDGDLIVYRQFRC